MPKPSEKRKLTPADVESRAATPEGLRGLDAAVARALGKKLDFAEWPPPYASCPADAPDRWKWWGEMIEKLGEYTMLTWARDGWEVVPGCGPCVGFGARTLPLALVKALAAAGRLEEETQ